MPRLRVSLSGVGGAGCQKPDCALLAPLNRHHKAHEAMWLGVWAHRASEPQLRARQRWQAFVRRYHEFREEDICRICTHHHAEIHSLYDAIIADDVAQTGLPLSLYSWKQARILMTKLKDACNVWLVIVTPGLDPAIYESQKALRRSILDKNAQRKHRRKDSQVALAKHRASKIRSSRKRRPRTKK